MQNILVGYLLGVGHLSECSNGGTKYSRMSLSKVPIGTLGLCHLPSYETEGKVIVYKGYS